MPKGSQGQKRKADVIGNAVLVMKIATGQLVESQSTRAAIGSNKDKLRLKDKGGTSSPAASDSRAV